MVRRLALSGRSVFAALLARRRWSGIAGTRNGGLSGLPCGKGVLFNVYQYICRVGGEGE